MNIVIATGIFPPAIGGPATYSKIVAEELSNRGHGVTVVTYGTNQTNVQNAGYKIHVVSRDLPKGLRHVAYFWRVLQSGASANVIYAQDAVSAGLPASAAALLLRKKFFLKIVGDHAWEQGMQRFGVTDLLDEFLAKKYGLRISMIRAAQKYAARRALRIIVPSAYLQSVVLRWGVPAEKIVPVPNAVSLHPYAGSKEEARRDLELGGGFVLLTVGRLVPWKGFEMLIRLMPRIAEKIPDAKLIIAGDGPDRQKLELGIKNYGLQNYTVLTGGMGKEKISLYMAAADLFLLNTGYEGFSHQLIEAMTAGISVVTTEAGGNKEIVHDGENALVARYNEEADWERQIVRLYNDTELRERLARGSANIAELYSVCRMVEKTESLILNSVS